MRIGIDAVPLSRLQAGAARVIPEGKNALEGPAWRQTDV